MYFLIKHPSNPPSRPRPFSAYPVWGNCR